MHLYIVTLHCEVSALRSAKAANNSFIYDNLSSSPPEDVYDATIFSEK